MPKFGTKVAFEGHDGKRLGFILGEDEEPDKFKVQSFDPQTGAGSVERNVPQGKGGHTFQPLK